MHDGIYWWVGDGLLYTTFSNGLWNTLYSEYHGCIITTGTQTDNIEAQKWFSQWSIKVLQPKMAPCGS